MISYEKVKRSFRTSTIVLAVFNIIFAVFSLFGLFGLFVTQQALNSGNVADLGLTAEQVQTLEAAVSPMVWIIAILGLLINIFIAVYCFINLSKVNKEQAASPLPYYVGIAWSTIGFFVNFFTMDNMTGIFIQLAIQAAFIFLYFYCLQQANRLKDKDQVNL